MTQQRGMRLGDLAPPNNTMLRTAPCAAADAERSRWRFIGDGEGIHWPDLDEDISVEGLLAGRRSGETQAALKRWLESRQVG